MARRRVPLGSLAVAALLLAGCSSSASDGAADRSTTSTSGPTNTSISSTPSSGCRAAPAPGPGRTEQSLTSGGRDRSFTRFVPTGATAGEPMSLVVDLTAYSPSSMEEGFSGFTKPNARGVVPADDAGAVVVTPEPVNGEGLLTWNITGTTDGWTDDQQFLVDLLDEMEATSCIDTGRVLVTGFAIGAVMASAFACEHADRVTALATVSGLWDPPGCQPSRPVPVISFHGNDDHFLPYDGGVGDRVGMLSLSGQTSAGLIPMASREGAVASSAAWAEHNGCAKIPKQSGVASGSVAMDWQNCKAAVELVTIDGGSHTWPGSQGMTALEGLLGPVSPQPDATAQILEFLDRHAN